MRQNSRARFKSNSFILSSLQPEPPLCTKHKVKLAFLASGSPVPMNEKQLRLIVVEDHPVAAAALEKYLTSLGHKVFPAADMESALTLSNSVPFDILLSDLALPDGDGWRLLQKLSARAPIRAVAMSGHNNAPDVARSMDAGFLDHLPKPLVPERLCGALERAAACWNTASSTNAWSRYEPCCVMRGGEKSFCAKRIRIID